MEERDMSIPSEQSELWHVERTDHRPYDRKKKNTHTAYTKRKKPTSVFQHTRIPKQAVVYTEE